jgi:hypothetical protein
MGNVILYTICGLVVTGAILVGAVSIGYQLGRRDTERANDWPSLVRTKKVLKLNNDAATIMGGLVAPPQQFDVQANFLNQETARSVHDWIGEYRKLEK